MGLDKRLYIWTGLFSLLVLALIFIIQDGPRIESNILKLLPSKQYNPIVDKAFTQFSEEKGKQLFFLVETETSQADDNVSFAVQELIEILKKNQYVESAYSGISEKERRSIAKFIFDNRFYLMTEGDASKIKNGDYHSFSDLVQQQLYSPFSGEVIRLLPKDPLLFSYRYAKELKLSERNFQQDNELIFLADKEHRYYVVRAKLKESPFSRSVQKALLKEISTFEKQWDSSRIKLYRTGAMFFAAHGFESGEREVSTIGVGSIAGIFLLILWAFRSLTPLISILLTISVGVASGFAVVHTIFNEIHLITLIFGASLIGVSVDYAFHYLCSSSVNRKERIERIFVAITLGLASSVIGYLALGTAPFPGLKQMAVFCTSGLIASYVTVVLLIPCLPMNARLTPTVLTQVNALASVFRAEKAKLLFFGCLIFPIYAGFSLWKAMPEVEDIRQFQNKNQELAGEQNKIKDVVALGEVNQFFIVKGRSQELLLESLEILQQQLELWKSEGIIGGYLSLGQYLPSRKRKQRNIELYSQLMDSDALNVVVDMELMTRIESKALTESFIQQIPGRVDIESSLQDLGASAISEQWLGKIDDEFVTIVSLSSISNLSEMKDLNADILFVDKVDSVSRIFSEYKKQSLLLLLLAIGVILFTLSIRRGLRNALIVIASPVCAISIAITTLLVFGYSVSLFNVLALFLVLGVGVDYGVFLMESGDEDKETSTAVLLAALTTLLSFGLLSLSETPAIQGFGVTMLFGICSAYILASISFRFLQSEKGSSVKGDISK
ncbi:MMPL family transporter [Aliikangiella sp. G2MR2-5]|uniref:MMPL family transporter n=1 Tax=Aliikangiella sp. G2MR2-5 TaxID=2788943 RepID=UPI0018AB00A5|nr:hypothetical protein [Aliikangiella sp. G2MR2-5]